MHNFLLLIEVELDKFINNSIDNFELGMYAATADFMKKGTLSYMGAQG